jgi:hypothetical protein
VDGEEAEDADVEDEHMEDAKDAEMRKRRMLSTSASSFGSRRAMP